jgi:hypothetical protein
MCSRYDECFVCYIRGYIQCSANGMEALQQWIGSTATAYGKHRVAGKKLCTVAAAAAAEPPP